MMEKKYIKVTKEIRKKLMIAFNIKEPGTISNYLNFRRNGDMAETVRAAALEHGGRMMLKDVDADMPVKRVKLLDNHGRLKAQRTY